MNRKHTLATAVTLMLCAASSAQADRRATKARKAEKQARVMARFDANGNGVLDPVEKQALKAAHEAKKAEKRARVMARFDANGNGVLDPAEKQALKAARKHRKGRSPGARRLRRWLAEKDANRDGVLIWEEVAPDRPDRVQEASERFRRLDVNRDGVVDQREIRRVPRRLRKK